MILTDADAEIYFPSLQLAGEGLNVAIRSAQMLAESPKGANRPLEVRSFSETHTAAGADRTFMVNNYPLLTDPAPVIKIREPHYQNFGRDIPASSWTTLTADQYEIDENLGQVQVLAGMASGSYPALRSGMESGRGNFQVKITYSSGFAFHPPDSTEATAIKQAVANILNFQNAHALPQGQSSLAQGIQQFTVDGVYSVSYSPAASANYRETMLEVSLTVLRAYQPRGFAA
jgi:hypothetical protein